MRTNRVVRKSIKRLRSKNRRNRVNRKTKKRIQKRTKRTQKRTKRTQKRTKRAKRSKNNRKTKKIKRSYELTGGMFPGFFEVGEGDIAAQRQQEQKRQQEQREQEQMKLKKTEAKERKSQYLIEEEKAKELFEEYLRIIHIMKQEQLVEILNGLKYEPYLIDQVRDIIKSSDRKKLIEMVFSNTSRLRQVNRELWNKYFADSEIILNYYRGSPVMEISSPTTFYNPFAA